MTRDPATRDTRRRVALPAQAQLADSSTFEVTLLDLSYDGCKVATAVALVPGAAIVLTVAPLGKLDAHVRWYADGQAGLCFKPDAPESADHRPRKHDRISLDATVGLRRSGQLGYTVHANDLSASGCKVEFVERPQVGERLWIKFDGFDAMEAAVCWVDGFSGGVEFSRAICAPVFELLLARLR
ncbi:MAG: PilZ domain-containing protein [Sphingomicrobium sp.]